MICFIKNIYGKNGADMAKKGESPYKMEQEDNHGWLWNAQLNLSHRGTLLNIVE